MQGGAIRLATEYQSQCYHKSDVLVKVHFQVIEGKGDRSRRERKWGVGGRKRG